MNVSSCSSFDDLHKLMMSDDVVVTADCPRTEYCSITLTDDSYQAFLYAIRNHYWYQMYIDDLPIWGLYFIVRF